MKLSEKIIKLRKNNGMSQEDLADRLQISRQSISRWENGSAKPDADNILQLSKLFGVSTDYLLHDEYESDNDLPKVKENNTILHTNLTLIAIIMQMATLNAASKPFQSGQTGTMMALEWIIKLVPLFACSVWMAHNLKYEEDRLLRQKNAKIELLYCSVQTIIAVASYWNQWDLLGTVLLLTVCLTYIFVVNPRYMNRPLTRRK